MVVTGFSEGGGLFDITPVENIFIAEYMGRAPGDYVKVYLLGLKLCYYPQQDYTTAMMARDLDLEEDCVKDAFVYWAQCGLVRILSRRPFNVSYNNIKHTLQMSEVSKGHQYAHQDLVLQLQRQFGGRRLLGPADVSRVMEWADDLKLPPEVISLVTAWCVQMKDRRVPFKYIDATMRNLVDQGITTYEAAEQYIKRYNIRHSDAAKILQRWNVNRAVTDDELELYDKWTHEFGFTSEVISQALKEMTGITRPNFKYLDKILINWYERGLRSDQDVTEHAHTNAKSRDDLKKILHALGAPLAITPEIMSMYDSWVADGFSSSAIEQAASALSSEGHTKVADLNAMLNRWRREGIVDDLAVTNHLEQSRNANKAIGDLLEIWGEHRSASGDERRSYIRWINKGYSHELIMAAAEAATHAKARLPYMEKILGAWKAEGVTDPNNIPVRNPKKQKKAPGENIIEHHYDEADYSAMYDSLEDA